MPIPDFGIEFLVLELVIFMPVNFVCFAYHSISCLLNDLLKWKRLSSGA